MGNCRFALLLVIFFAATATWGQSSDNSAAPSAPTPTPTPVTRPVDDSHYASDNPVKFLRNLGRDQKDIWTSPFKARIQDLNWIVPLTGVSVGLINADAELSSRITGTSSLGKHASTVSNGGLALLLGASGCFICWVNTLAMIIKKKPGFLRLRLPPIVSSSARC